MNSIVNTEASLSRANSEDPNKCTICYNSYSDINPVMAYSTCGHIICFACVNDYGSNRCQVCNQTGGTYKPQSNLTQTAKKKSVVYKPGEKITFKVIDLKGVTRQLTMLPTQTIADMLQLMKEQYGVAIPTININNKVYDSSEKAQLQQAGVVQNSIAKGTNNFKGGRR